MSRGQNRQNYAPIYLHLEQYSQVGVAAMEQLRETQ